MFTEWRITLVYTFLENISRLYNHFMSMATKPIIIIYTEGLSSFVLYRDLIELHPELIEVIFRLPAIPRRNEENAKGTSPIFRKLIDSSFMYLWFNFCVVALYSVIARLRCTRLEDLAQKNGISVVRCVRIDEQFLQKIEALKPEYIFNNSGNILKSELILKAKFGVINFHCAPLPEYRGAANYFWILANGEKDTYATLHYVNEGLDTGNIITFSEIIQIEPGATVFRLWYQLRKEGYKVWDKILLNISRHEQIPAFAQDDSHASVRSFPDKRVVKQIRKRGYGIISINEIWTIIRIAYTGRLFK